VEWSGAYPTLIEAPAQGNPLEFLHETYPRKTREMGLLHGENCVILASTVFDWSTHVTDGRTDGRTDGIAMAYMRYSIYAVARKNVAKGNKEKYKKYNNNAQSNEIKTKTHWEILNS